MFEIIALQDWPNELGSANSILGKITHFYEVTSMPVCSENMVGKSKNHDIILCFAALAYILI